MCMFSRKEEKLNVKQAWCFNSASEAAQVSIHSTETLLTLSVESFLKKKKKILTSPSTVF